MKTPPSLKDPISAIRKLANDLRDKDGGCPWDIKQDHKSLIKHLIEEAYETVDALEKLDKNIPETFENLKEELGDLFFQVVLHSQLAAEKNHFDLDDVSRAITEKLIFRHPHVYGEISDENLTSEEVLENWERLKRKEREKKNQGESMLDSVPAALPALLKAYRLGQKVSRVGFDWSSLTEIKEKLNEETDELEEEILQAENSKHDNLDRIEDEFGDLLFVLTQYGRHLKIDPEKALQRANKKFIDRFSYIENCLKEKLDQGESISIDEWELYWQKAKEREVRKEQA